MKSPCFISYPHVIDSLIYSKQRCWNILVLGCPLILTQLSGRKRNIFHIRKKLCIGYHIPNCVYIGDIKMIFYSYNTAPLFTRIILFVFHSLAAVVYYLVQQHKDMRRLNAMISSMLVPLQSKWTKHLSRRFRKVCLKKNKCENEIQLIVHREQSVVIYQTASRTSFSR